MNLFNLNKSKLFWCVLLGLLGFAGNWLKYELFFNVDFLFGSFFVMLAIIRFGTAAGVIAGFGAACCTYLLWNHPWAIIIMTAEAAFVSWRLQNDKRNCLTEDILFWLFFGAPLVWFFYFHILHVGSQSTQLIVLKQSINGVFNALLASIMHLSLRLQSKNAREYPSFQELLFITMVTIILIPSFIYLVLKVRDEMQMGKQQISDAATHTGTAARSAISQWFQVHHQDVKLLATLIGSPATSSPEKMQNLVELVRQASPAFLRMGVLNHDAISVAYSPLAQNGTSNIGINFSDRPYIETLRTALKPLIPDMVPGRLADNAPILSLLVPMVGSHGYAGYCAGVVDLTLVKNLLVNLVGTRNENVTLLDRNGNVVVSTRNDLKSMAHFQRPPDATILPISDDYYHWIPETKRGSSAMSRWMKSVYVSESRVSEDLAWKLVVEISPVPMLVKLSASSINAFLMMASIIVLSAIFARFMSNSFVKPLQILQQETQFIPEVLVDRLPEFDTHTSRVRELNGLNENFRLMTQVLHDRMHEVRASNQARLTSVEREKKLLHEKEMLVKDLHDGIGGLMTKISMLAQYAKAKRTITAYDDITDQILELAYEGSAEVRSFMNSLESDQQAWSDLLAEITEHCERMLILNDTELTVSSSIAADAPGVGVFRYVNIVRVFREAITNIVKHAGAHHVQLQFVVTSDRFTLTVSDDGIGYDTTSVRKRGVANMYSRAALLEADFFIISTPGRGTSITLSTPFDEPELELPCV